MRYPKKLSKRADEILAARRQTAQARHGRAMLDTHRHCG